MEEKPRARARLVEVPVDVRLEHGGLADGVLQADGQPAGAAVQVAVDVLPSR